MGKKLIAMILTCLLIATMVGCAKKEANSDAQSNSNNATSSGSSSNNSSSSSSGNSSSNSNGASTNTSNNQLDTSEPQTITIWCWDPNYNINALKIAEEIYQREHPNVSLNIVEIGRAHV